GFCSVSFDPVCDGITYHYCFAGRLSDYYCGPSTHCTPEGCVGNGASCTGPSRAGRCEGAKVFWCDGGRESTLDCATLPSPGVCRTLAGQSGTTYAFCAPAPADHEDACDVASHVDTCDGDDLVYCDGQLQRVQCSLYGARCVINKYGKAACAWS